MQAYDNIPTRATSNKIPALRSASAHVLGTIEQLEATR